MRAQSLQHMARRTKQSGGSYLECSEKTDFGGSVIIKHKDIVKAYGKEPATLASWMIMSHKSWTKLSKSRSLGTISSQIFC